MINAFILCDLFENLKRIIQQTEKEALNVSDMYHVLFKCVIYTYHVSIYK